MKKQSRLLMAGFLAACVVLMLGMASCSSSDGGGGTKSAIKSSFDEVTAHLDKGGQIYLYVSSERLVKIYHEFSASMRKMMKKGLAQAPEGPGEALGFFDFVNRLILHSGFTEISGIGMSSVALDEEVNHSKFVVHHYKDKGKGLIWKLGDVGAQPLEQLDMLPASTVLAGFTQFKPSVLWQWVKKETDGCSVAKVKQGVGMVEPMLKQQGVDLPKLLDSLSGTMGLVLTLDKKKTIQVPMGPKPLALPEPAVAFVMGVKDETLFNLLQSKLPMLKASEDKGIKKLVIPVPPMPFPVAPEIVQMEGLLMVVSHPSITKAMLAAKQGGNGLTAEADFKKLTRSMPKTGNSFRYVSPRLFGMIKEVQKMAVKAQAGDTPWADDMFKLFPAKLASFQVCRHTETGFVFTANHTMNMEGLILLPATAVVGVVAAIAIPNLLTALQKGKQKATMGDMKSISMALESYITDHAEAPPGNSLAEIKDKLQPFYIKVLPLKDGWGNDLLYKRGMGGKKTAYAVASAGRGGEFEGWEQKDFYLVTAMLQFEKDIIISNGNFVYGPKVR